MKNSDKSGKTGTGSFNPATFALRVIQGAVIGLGAVLPGISGGVLSVIFGIYKPLMEFISNPFARLKSHLPLLFPVILGGAVGFLGVSNILSFFLEKYTNPSVCLFIGLILGMLPSLYDEAGKNGREKSSYISLIVCATVIFCLLIALDTLSVKIEPGFMWFIFCGFCLALSIIAPGMSFSTLLMPLGLYTPFIEGIGHLDFGILIPAGIGALATVLILSNAVNYIFDHYYAPAYHGIIGVVLAATVMIIPWDIFTGSLGELIASLTCLIAGIALALVLDRFNKKYDQP